MDKIARLKEILESSRRAVFFGGAGMSTESGIPDFRSAGGIYSETLHQEFSPEQMASHSFLMAHPEEFFDFYRRRFVYLDAAPNAGHYALAELERRGHTHHRRHLAHRLPCGGTDRLLPRRSSRAHQQERNACRPPCRAHHPHADRRSAARGTAGGKIISTSAHCAREAL